MEAKSLYAYIYQEEALNEIFRKGTVSVKVGESINVDDRVYGQTKGAGVKEEAYIFWVKSIKGSIVKSDYDVHTSLVRNKIASRVTRKDKNSTEWFTFSMPSLIVGMVKSRDITDEAAIIAVTDLISKFLEKAFSLAIDYTPFVSKRSVKTVEIVEDVFFGNCIANLLWDSRKWYDTEVLALEESFSNHKHTEQPRVMYHRLACHVLEKVDLDPDFPQNILIIDAIEVVMSLIYIGYPSKFITFATKSDLKKEKAEACGVNFLNLGTLLSYISGIRNRDLKFDACIQNPPYDNGLHIDFVNLGVSTSDITVAVHPAIPIINRKPGKKNSKDAEFLSNLKKYKSSVELYNGNDLFSAIINAPISITFINKTVKEDGIEFEGNLVPLDEINLLGAWAGKYYDKIPKDNLQVRCNRQKGGYFTGTKKYFVNQCWKPFSGGYTDAGFFTMISKSNIPSQTLANNTDWLAWEFDTEVEALNFIKYCKTKFARFWLALYKVNANLHRGEVASVPWVDFTQHWDDEKLFDCFEIPEEDRVKICNVIKDYY